MAVLQLDLYSYELAMNTQATIILPERRGVPHVPGNGKSYPVLYLLHGHGQDHTSWLRLSRIEHYLQNTDLIVVMPNGGRGCYVDGVGTHRYGTYLTKELPVALQNWFHISPRREDTFIAGLSMGGYGAFHAALSHPDSYAAAAALSAGIRMDRLDLSPASAEKGLALPDFQEIDQNFRAIFGDGDIYEESAYSLKKLARDLHASGASCPRLLQLCGDEDPLLNANRDFAVFMRTECPTLPHEFRVTPGMHNYDFWDREIVTALRFFGFSL